MKICILGGGNPYALNLASHLERAGIQHFGIGRSRRGPNALWQVSHYYPYQTLHLLLQFDAVMAVLDTERPDVIVNYAAQGEGAASWGVHAEKFYMTNTVGLVRLAEALSMRTYLERFIQIGTSELYGSVAEPAIEDSPIKPTSPYAVSKAAFDLHLATMRDFPWNVIRPSNAYCPGQQLHRIMPAAIIHFLSGRTLRTNGPGNVQKSYIHADDLSKAVLIVLKRGDVRQVYNCGPEHPITIRVLIELIRNSCGGGEIESGPARASEDAKYWLDSSKLKSIGWKQGIGLHDGIDDMIAWVRRYPELLSMDTSFKGVRP